MGLRCFARRRGVGVRENYRWRDWWIGYEEFAFEESKGEKRLGRVLKFAGIRGLPTFFQYTTFYGGFERMNSPIWTSQIWIHYNLWYIWRRGSVSQCTKSCATFQWVAHELLVGHDAGFHKEWNLLTHVPSSASDHTICLAFHKLSGRYLSGNRWRLDKPRGRELHPKSRAYPNGSQVESCQVSRSRAKREKATWTLRANTMAKWSIRGIHKMPSIPYRIPRGKATKIYQTTDSQQWAFLPGKCHKCLQPPKWWSRIMLNDRTQYVFVWDAPWRTNPPNAMQMQFCCKTNNKVRTNKNPCLPS